ncbi:potassium channel family protein [Variovorax sp. J22R115]|uniref:potassium channel family protein n=1 Tax=Variovorax sp. J22R115 TaxID=3053509 RepID=UPI00257710FF|nr:potassium channel family protein [Variovorax sp. J22R115]MDM0050448.1 potassium channel family protein [Variovorax sp. J22R115]
MTLIAILVGVVLALATLIDAFEVVLLPRPVRRRLRLNRYFFKCTWAAWVWCADLWPSGRRREDFIGVFGPLSMVMLFALWAASLIVGFGLMQWGLQGLVPDSGSVGLVDQIIVSGDAFFTLGYGDNVPHHSLARLLVIVEAGTGFGFIALTIGYLPVLYQHFTRRDLQLIEFSARAGTPPTAAALLGWHMHGTSAALERWLRDWEIWASDLVESQAVYPMLAFYRSQHEGHSWLGSLAVVLDVCTLLIAGADDVRRLQATATFCALRRVLDEASESLRVAPARQVSTRLLDPEALRLVTPTIRRILPDWRDDEPALEAIRRLRRTYEPRLEGLAAYLLLQLPEWINPEEAAGERFGRDAVVRQLTDHHPD